MAEVRDSSMDAYIKLCEGNKLENRRRDVFLCFASAGKPICDYVAAETLGWAINRVNGRRSELERMGYLRSIGRLPGPPCGENVHHFELNPECLKPEWKPKPLERKQKIDRVKENASQAGRTLAEYKAQKRRRALAAAILPLFDGSF